MVRRAETFYSGRTNFLFAFPVASVRIDSNLTRPTTRFRGKLCARIPVCGTSTRGAIADRERCGSGSPDHVKTFHTHRERLAPELAIRVCNTVWQRHIRHFDESFLRYAREVDATPGRRSSSSLYLSVYLLAVSLDEERVRRAGKTV